MFQRILVPVDIDDIDMTERILATVQELAREASVMVRLVYVRPFVIDAALAYLPPDFFSREEQSAISQLVGLREKAGLDPDRTSISSPCGNVRDELRKIIGEFDPDLIVLGPHRTSLAKAFFLGSTASGIVREASCSVLILRNG